MFLDMGTRERRPFAALEKDVFNLAFSPNGSFLASAHDGGGVTLWDRRSGQKVSEEKFAHRPVAWQVEFSRDGQSLVSGGSDATSKLWDVIPRGLKLHHTLRSTGVVFSPDGRRVASSSDEGVLKLWDTKTGLEVAALYGHRGKVVGVVFSRDDNTIYSAAQDGEVRVWKAPPLDELKAPLKEKEVKQ
jgi:FOG: WD40 repeat